MVHFGFISGIEPTSYALLINVVAVWCTIVVSLGTSAFADHGRSSRKLMLTFCTLLAVATAFMFIGPLKPDVWWLSGLLMVVGEYHFTVPNLNAEHRERTDAFLSLA